MPTDPPDPPTVTFTGIVNVAPDTLEIVYVPEIDGVEPVCPTMLTTSLLANGTFPVQVMTVGLATDDDTMGFPIICAPVVVIEYPLLCHSRSQRRSDPACDAIP
jgi:hypothetical protein